MMSIHHFHTCDLCRAQIALIAAANLTFAARTSHMCSVMEETNGTRYQCEQ